MFVPRRTTECDELLTNSSYKVHALPLELALTDTTTLTLECARSFANFLLDDCDDYKVSVVKSILQLEAVFGQIKYKFAKGDQATKLMQRLASQAGLNYTDTDQ